MTDVSPLFRPFRLRGMELKNRIVMAPMTRSHSPGAFPNDENVAYYARRAAADVGLILSEGTLTRRKGASNDANIPLFWGEKPLAGWQRVIEAVHAAGGKMGPQLWHQGMSRKPGTGHFPDAPSDGPSGITLQGKKVSEEPGEAEVLDMAQAYADAAADAKRLGFDCVELHGAHAYLIDEFFWSVTNQRTDRFGGSIEKRAEFAAEAIRRSRAAIGDLPLIIRISQWKSVDYNAKVAVTPQELERWINVLIDAGVDAVHCSQRRILEPEFPDIDGPKGLNFAGWVKKLTGIPTIAVGSVGLSSEFTGAFRGEGSAKGKLDETIERLDKGEFDLVAVGRALLQDPEWVVKVKANKFDELRDYDAAALKTYY
ncbi:MAG: 12-oxophytodienoate reductase [Alphaproteobacteria bacterium]|nr:12-oxophytodienoate reductase [Alphaproteobacteria bacterium]